MKQRKVIAVIYALEKEKKKYLVLHRKLRWSGWELMKETMESGESYEETLRRGIKEETGVTKINIEKEKKVNILMNKDAEIVYAYLVRVSATEKIDIAHEQEHDDYQWATKEEALKLLAYENTKKLLKELADS